jgi:RNA polymerase sigma factor (sigma-70 family)
VSNRWTRATLLDVFDPNPDRAEDKYDQLFVQLRSFFRSRHRPIAEDLAMETLKRGFSRIQAGAVIYVDPIHYFLKIAKNVAIETWRKSTPESAALVEEIPDRRSMDLSRLDARIYLDECLSRLTQQEREILIRYQDEDHVELAAALGITHATLRVRYLRTKRKIARLMHDASTGDAMLATTVPGPPLKET